MSGPILLLSCRNQATNGDAAMNKIAIGMPIYKCMRKPACCTRRACSGFCAVKRDTAWIDPVTITLFTGETSELMRLYAPKAEADRMPGSLVVMMRPANMK